MDSCQISPLQPLLEAGRCFLFVHASHFFRIRIFFAFENPAAADKETQHNQPMLCYKLCGGIHDGRPFPQKFKCTLSESVLYGRIA